MKADTWMALYVGAYLADTMHLGREHHGSYLLLIMAAFKNTGWLPADDGLLAQIAKCSAREWAAERAMYAGFFQVTDERWTHKRVTIEWEKAQTITQKRSEAGSKGAAKRWQSQWQTDGKGIAKPFVSHWQNDGPIQREERIRETPSRVSPDEDQTSPPVAAREDGPKGPDAHDVVRSLAARKAMT